MNTNTDRTSISLTRQTIAEIKAVTKPHNIKIYEYIVALVEVAAANTEFQQAAINNAREKIITLKNAKTAARRATAETNKALLKQIKTMSTTELQTLLKLANKQAKQE
jgi:hypothetical protein